MGGNFQEHEISVWRAEFYERVLGNPSESITTLRPAQISEAERIGLMPAGLAVGHIVVAYRNKGAQGLMTIPEERYDGLQILEIFGIESPP